MSTTEQVKYIEYTPKSEKPIPVGAVVSENLNFKMKWQQPDTADRCHENAFRMYDEIRRKEDEFITSASKEPGLAIRYYDGSSPGVDDFRSDEFKVSSIPVMTDGSKSFELSGFFVPDETAYYSFSFQRGITGRIWVGDEACYEFKKKNQYMTKKLYKNRYYAVRFQYVNTGASSSGNIEIIVSKNGKRSTTPNFQTIKSQDGTQFIRKLMYYGLVQSIIKGKFLFYFNNGRHYSEIQEAKHKNLIVKSRPLSYRAKISQIQNYIVDENKKLLIKMNKHTYTYRIINATYGPEIPQRNCPDMNVKDKLIDIASKNNGIISIGPGYKDFNSAYGGNPCPGKFKTTKVLVEATIKENMLKNRRVILNNKCQLVVDYNDPNSTSPDPLLMIPIASNGEPCNEGSSLIINDNGTVTLNGRKWIEPTKYERDNAKENKQWIPNTTLTRGSELTTLVSDNRKYKLKVSRDTGIISFKIGIDPSIEDSGEIFTRNNAFTQLKSYYLYRPNYSELGGRKYMVDLSDNSITLIPSNSNRLKQIPNYSSMVGYPIPTPGKYDNHPGQTPNSCRLKCNLSRDCGHFFYSANTRQCLIDVSANTRPIYNTTPNGFNEINPMYIYIANRNMNSSTYSFIKEEVDGEYTDRTIKPDTVATQAVTNTISNGVSAAVNRNSRLANIVSGLRKETEGFSDIPERYLKELPLAPDTSVEEGRISDLQAIIYQQNVLYSLSSIAALSFLAGAIVLARN